MNSELWLFLHFTSWTLILSFICYLFFFFLLFLFLQVLKCHPPVLDSYSEHISREGGRWKCGGRRRRDLALLLLPGLGRHFY